MKSRKADKARLQFDSGFHEGFIIKDNLKRQWVLGALIGRGGFGNVYSVQKLNQSVIIDDDDLVTDFSTKIEPHSNGPLFTEIAFYKRVATKEKISKWCQKKSMNFIGIPTYLASGCDNVNNNYRFIILPRLGENVENVWRQMNFEFGASTVYQLGYRFLECLEYVHFQGYSHGDLKTSNLMTGYKDDFSNSRIYLMDFGLASLFMVDSKHKPYKENPKSRHDGTIEYTSVDAHNGAVVSRRGDLVNLVFVMLHLLTGNLPWLNVIDNKDKVFEEKIKFLDNPVSYLSTQGVPMSDSLKGIFNFLEQIRNLKYEDIPNYDKLYTILNTSYENFANRQSKIAFSNHRVCISKEISIETIGGSRKMPVSNECVRKNPSRLAKIQKHFET